MPQIRSVSIRNITTGLFQGGIVILIVLFWVARNPSLDPGKSISLRSKPDPKKLEFHVRALVEITPNRSYRHFDSMHAAEDYIATQFKQMGYEVEMQPVDVNNHRYYNIIARYNPVNSRDIVVIGAHYDACEDYNPGADDNASGVAGLLEVARIFAEEKPALPYPVEFVAYTLEEPPYFGGREMGSYIHAEQLKKQGFNVKLMLSLEMIGYFSDDFLSQSYFVMPILYAIYPWTGNFISLIGSTSNRAYQRRLKSAMVANSEVPVYSISSPAFIPGVDFSDHRNYWEMGWPAFMVTDTAFLRNLEYHQRGDTPERLNYLKMAEVVRAVYAAVNVQ